MPGDKTHHTDKWRRCVDEVVGKGHDESSASAICTTSLQNAGEAIFEGAEMYDGLKTLEGSEGRNLHLLGATGTVRYEQLNGRRHLVVPVVALMEGVIHPVNAETPEFVSAKVLQDAAASWIGKPVTLGHPKKDGTQCSANEPSVRKAHGVGVIMKSAFDKKLMQEAWIDEEKAKQLHPQMYERLASGGREEVSVGAFVVTSPQGGDYNGKRYKATWLQTQGDHLAFLPGGRGACSCEMGCGTHRAAMHLVTAEAIEPLPESLPAPVFSALDGETLEQRISAVYSAVNEKYRKDVTTSMSTAYTQQVFDDYAIVQDEGETYQVPYEMKDGQAVLGEPKKVKQAWVAAAGAMVDCGTCDGTGQVKKDGKQEDCPTYHGEGEIKVAEMRVLLGSGHSTKDMAMIQAVHDHAMALGAECDRKNYKMMEAGEKPAPTPSIRHEGGRYVLYSSDGSRNLGSHDTEGEAQAHRSAIDAITRKWHEANSGAAAKAAGCGCHT